jgi:oligopeptide transport system substrate-binding protein
MKKVRFTILLVFLFTLGCGIPNNPYRAEETGENIFYSTFREPPKHLDPAVSYSAGEYRFLQQVYEPPLQYHYLKRPYELITLTAAAVPEPVYYGQDGAVLEGDPAPEAVQRVVYQVRIKPGIRYQPHPCFALDDNGEPLYFDLAAGQMAAFGDIEGFPTKGSRDLKAADYVYQIKRLAHPQLHSPIFSTMANYIVGLDGLGQTLNGELERIRAERRQAGGVLYNQEADERGNPIWLDLDRFSVDGLRVVDEYTYEIVLKQKYPQFVFWLAMPFFSPIPREADRFFAQAAVVQANLKLDNRPIGTGAYRMSAFLPHREIILVRNEYFHGETYPTQGDAGDDAAGLLADAGKPLPFIDKAVYKLEKEAIPRWNKFIQGYFENSGIATEVFDQVIQVGMEGGLELSGDLESRGVRLIKSVSPTTSYYAFNMLDDVVGGYTEDRQRFRQAISIVIDEEESIQIFRNGRGVPAQDLLPPGIFGHREGQAGVNPYVYEWNEALDEAQRKSVEYARGLLAEAGYPGGKDGAGKPLTLYYDTYRIGASAKAQLDWLRKQLAKLDIDLQVRQTDYNRFREKVRQGNFQFLSWGWHADYPDPENFLFLLYGPNGKTKHGGANSSNYDNPQFNELFKEMESMENGPERLALVDQMLEICRKDAPWVWGLHPVSFGLYHEWFMNAKPMDISYNTLKFKKLETDTRQARRQEWNEPIWWPAVVAGVLLAGAVVPAVVAVRRREREVELE